MLCQCTLLRVWLGGVASTPALGLDLRSPSGQFVNVIPEGTQNRRTAAHFNPTAIAHATQFAQPEARQLVARLPTTKPTISKWSRQLRADVYDELLKLPLRYALHDFDKLQRHLHASDGGVARAGAAAGLPDGIYAFSEGSSSSAGGSNEEDAQGGMRKYYGVAGRDSSVGYAPPLGPADPLDTIPFFVHRTSNGQLPGKIHSMDAKRLMPHFYMRIQNIDGNIFSFEEELMKIFPTKKIFVRSHSVYVYNVNRDGRAVLHHWLLGLGF